MSQNRLILEPIMTHLGFVFTVCRTSNINQVQMINLLYNLIKFSIPSYLKRPFSKIDSGVINFRYFGTSLGIRTKAI
jgi:hypothetical protein